MLLANKHHIAAIFSLHKQLYPSNYTPIVEFGRNIIILYQLCDTWNPLQNFQRSLFCETVPFIKKTADQYCTSFSEQGGSSNVDP